MRVITPLSNSGFKEGGVFTFITNKSKGFSHKKAYPIK
jgi:hypothetical protein